MSDASDAGARVPVGTWVALAAFAAYVGLVPGGPGLRDAGELGAAAAVLGVPHPTGFPVDMLLLHAATLLPVGSIAFRQNLMVALVSSIALGLLADVTSRAARRAGLASRAGAVGGVFAALCLGAWETFLGTGLVVEVYSTALVVSLLSLGLGLAAPSRAHRALGLLAGLAFGVHATARLFVLPIGAWVLLRQRRSARSLGVSLGLALLGVAVVAYLPLASLRDAALDWGDPETFGRLGEHLSAARIRAAFATEMGSLAARPAAAFASQLAELWPAALAASLALAWGARRAPAAILFALAVIAVDTAFALVLHPMGVEARQVGHAAGAALAGLGGLGVSAAWSLSRGRGLRAAVAVGVGTLASFALVGAPAWLGQDAEVAGELYGSGGSLLWLPPRAVVVCSSDDACAGALFARHAEGARPDVAVVAGQHLWEPTVRRVVAESLRGSGLPADLRPDAPIDRAALAQRAMDHLAQPEGPRPVVWEGGGAARPLGVALVPRRAGPWLAVGSASTREVADTLEALRAAHRARVGPSAAHTVDGRGAWSRAFEGVGRGSLEAGSLAGAVEAFEEAVRVAPDRAVAWTNLSVARSRRGDLEGAVAAARRSIALAPERAAAWLNLARYVAALGDLEGARRVLDEAARAGVVDPRLDALGLRVDEALGPSQRRIGHDR